jgi:hypothetical protein
MTNPPDDLHPVQLLALSRLLVAGAKGAKRDLIQKDLEPLLGHRWSGGELAERLDATLEELASAGLLDRVEQGKGKKKTQLFALTESGRARTLGALGLETLPPKTNWGQVLSKYLAAVALGLPAPKGADAKSFGVDGGFKAAVLRVRHDLPVREFPTAAQAQDALLWKLLGHATSRKFDLKTVRGFLLARALGESEPTAEKDAFRRLIVRDLQPRNSKPAELRAAAVRLWLDESLAGPEPHPEPPPAGSNGSPAASLPLDDFARRVVAAARTSPTGRFGENKVFIAHAWRALRDDPDFRGMDLDAFKSRLAEANQARHLDLSRADLVEAMDPDDIRSSETTHFGAQYHFIRF